MLIIKIALFIFFLLLFIKGALTIKTEIGLPALIGLIASLIFLLIP